MRIHHAITISARTQAESVLNQARSRVLGALAKRRFPNQLNLSRDCKWRHRTPRALARRSCRKELVIAWKDKRYESGRGQPHSKTLPRCWTRCSFRKVLECGCPLPLFDVSSTYAIRRWKHIPAVVSVMGHKVNRWFPWRQAVRANKKGVAGEGCARWGGGGDYLRRRPIISAAAPRPASANVDGSGIWMAMNNGWRQSAKIDLAPPDVYSMIW